MLLELDISSASNNRAYLANGLNGGTLGELTGTITDTDPPSPLDSAMRLSVTLPPELNAAQAGDQFVEIWLHDLDDDPFTDGDRDQDQIDIALRLQNRVAVRDLVLNGEVADPLTFDIDLANQFSNLANLIVSVLMFPTNADTAPTFVAREGFFGLDALLGETTDLTLGTANIVQFGDTTVNENVGNAAFAGTLMPASDLVVNINFRTQNGTTPGEGSAQSGQDYQLITNGVLRFDPGETQEMITVPIIDDDDDGEPTESFDVQLELDIRFPATNRAYIDSGLNGGTFGQLTGTITDND